MIKEGKKIISSETTKILFDRETNWYYCMACGHIMGYQFDFKWCPYCRRKITKTEKRC